MQIVVDCFAISRPSYVMMFRSGTSFRRKPWKHECGI